MVPIPVKELYRPVHVYLLSQVGLPGIIKMGRIDNEMAVKQTSELSQGFLADIKLFRSKYKWAGSPDVPEGTWWMRHVKASKTTKGGVTTIHYDPYADGYGLFLKSCEWAKDQSLDHLNVEKKISTAAEGKIPFHCVLSSRGQETPFHAFMSKPYTFCLLVLGLRDWEHQFLVLARTRNSSVSIH